MSGTDRDRNGIVMSRRGLLKCAAWSGAGVVWVMQGGVLKALQPNPAFVVHTGDVTHLSKPEQFDDAARIIDGVGRPVHYVPGEHDVIGDDGAGFFAKFNGSAERKWHSFDYNGTHFV